MAWQPTRWLCTMWGLLGGVGGFSQSSGGVKPVILRELVSSCVDACQRGCAAIAAVEASSGPVEVRRKVAGDAKSALTRADLEAQEIIVSCLRATWPGLRVVGEEDEAETRAVEVPEGDPLRVDLCGPARADEEVVALEDVVVFVDPLDGTREFVEGRLDAVQSLVGISVRGRPRAGVAGLPFPDGDRSSAPLVSSFGGGGGGDHTNGALSWHGGRRVRETDERVEVIVATGDSAEDPAMLVAKRAALETGAACVAMGATGNKFLALVEGRCDVAVLHRKTCAWDTCGWEAALVAAGVSNSQYFQFYVRCLSCG